MSINTKSQLPELEDEIQKLFKNGDLSDMQTAFDIGLKFGRELEKENIEDYKFIFWEQREQQKARSILMNTEISSINKFLLSLVKKAFTEHFKENGYWSISERDYDLRWSRFSDEIVEKHCIQYAGMGAWSYDDFKCNFNACGKLKELFLHYGLSNALTVIMVNSSGDNHLEISRIENIEKGMYGIRSPLDLKNDWTLEKFKEFHDALVKLFLFELIE